MKLTLGVVALLALLLLAAPLFVVVLGAAALGFASIDVDLSVLAIEMLRLADTPLLLSLPLFTLAGYVLAEAGTSQRLVRVTGALVGWLPSGLAVVGFLACAVFTALTGASGVTIVALGALLLPALRQAGYDDRYSLGLVTASGSLGLLLPPSVPLILYGILAQQLDVGAAFTIQELFLAGLFPALLMVLLLCLWTWWRHRDGRIPTQPFDGREALAALWAARWEVPLPFVVLGGVFGGVFAVSEAAAVTAAYVIVVECLFYREIPFRRLPKLMAEAGVMVGGILVILGAALAFTNVLVDQEIPQRLFETVSATVESRWLFLLILNVLLLALGAVLDIFSAIVIMVPLILPLAVGYGIDPVHLGIIFLANMQIGYFTPPIGMNLFIASVRFRQPVTALYAASWPFMVVLLLAVLLITYVPALSLWLPGR